MISKTAFRSAFLLSFLIFCINPNSAFADNSHARIIRLSYVQGDVRITHNVSGDPLQSADSAWEAAALNAPIEKTSFGVFRM